MKRMKYIHHVKCKRKLKSFFLKRVLLILDLMNLKTRSIITDRENMTFIMINGSIHEEDI